FACCFLNNAVVEPSHRLYSRQIKFLHLLEFVNQFSLYVIGYFATIAPPSIVLGLIFFLV
ncbi:MAG: hypothetical protein Q7T55_14400, partial [Solirubrobacteraceae bacterium]|nr:hypothetical protein [Solirubrobacteraceae bacterium]